MDARLRRRAPQRQVCICVVLPFIVLDFLRLYIGYAGRWVLAVLLRSIRVCTPILGSFNVLCAAVVFGAPTLALRLAWSSSLPAIAFHRSPQWLGGVAASISRAEPLPAGRVDIHAAQSSGAPRFACTASSLRAVAMADGGTSEGRTPSQP